MGRQLGVPHFIDFAIEARNSVDEALPAHTALSCQKEEEEEEEECQNTRISVKEKHACRQNSPSQPALLTFDSIY